MPGVKREFWLKDADLQAIKTMYEEGKSVSSIGRQVKRDRTTVQGHIDRMVRKGELEERNPLHHWYPDEVELMKVLYLQGCSSGAIANRLARPYWATHSKIQNMIRFYGWTKKQPLSRMEK
jgi:hypothetical protein